MENRKLKEPEQAHYFAPVAQVGDIEEGTKEMSPLYPFVVSGGKNTERYYFTHVSAISNKYKFNIRPKYFGDESSYTDVFPKRIAEILSKNVDAKIFCVFDMDTVVSDGLQDKHADFVAAFKSVINSVQVLLCESMPSFEFWLLLHFTDYEGLLKNYSKVSNVLAPYLKPYFNNATVPFKKLIKKEKYLKKPDWVRLLLDEDRLKDAVERAKKCLSREKNENGRHSYTNVFKAFE